MEDAIGDVSIDIKSYSLLMNNNGLLLLHPLMRNSIDYNDGLYSEFLSISAADVEPIQFVENNIFQSMLNGENGYKEVTITYKQSLRDPIYNGYSNLETDVIYFYSSIDPLLSFGVVVWNDDKLNHDNILNISELKANEMDSRLARFNLFHVKCNGNNDTQDWATQAEVVGIDTSKISNINNYKNLFSQYDFYNKKNISLKYSSFMIYLKLIMFI